MIPSHHIRREKYGGQLQLQTAPRMRQWDPGKTMTLDKGFGKEREREDFININLHKNHPIKTMIITAQSTRPTHLPYTLSIYVSISIVVACPSSKKRGRIVGRGEVREEDWTAQRGSSSSSKIF
jgi:hypothetical protein